MACIGTFVLAACSSSSDTNENPAPDASPDSALSDGGLPDAFGDCDGASVCEVGLGAFSAKPGTTPYCPTAQAELDLSCPAPGLQTATCGDLFVMRVVYGFPGDFYECIYQGGALVGAKWAPDNHPTQIAGTQLPESCALMPACADAGTD